MNKYYIMINLNINNLLTFITMYINININIQ